MALLHRSLIKLMLASTFLGACSVTPPAHKFNSKATNQISQQQPVIVRFGYETVDDVKIFYREAGDPSKTAVVLLHGFPASSHMYRDVLATLGDQFYLIAPDYPGFGDSEYPSPENYTYTFDNIAATMDKFLEKRNLDKFVLMIHDYGAPIGMRIATKHPGKIAGLISMNGNVYEEGVDPNGWAPIMKYWDNKTPELENMITQNVFGLEGMKWQYTHGTRNPDKILPDNWNLDFLKISRPGQHEVQLRLFYDYQNNVKLYPKWQKYLRNNQPPLLVVWGKNDAFFSIAGAEGFRGDVEDMELYLLDTGHFALEEEGPFITGKMRQFISTLD